MAIIYLFDFAIQKVKSRSETPTIYKVYDYVFPNLKDSKKKFCLNLMFHVNAWM